MARHGENIYKRKDGRYEGRFMKGRRLDGHVAWGYVYGKTYAEAKQRLRQKRTENALYAVSESDRLFQELSVQWLTAVSLGVKESTLSHYAYTLNKYILPVLGTCHLKDLNETVLEKGLLRIISPTASEHKPLGKSMAQECVAMVRRICRFGNHIHLLRPLNILVKLPGASKNEKLPLTKNERTKIKTYVMQAPTAEKVGLLLQMDLGMRIGEVCGLQWKDFDLRFGTVQVCKTVCRIYSANHHTKVVVQSPKTSSSVRLLPIPEYILTLLRALGQHTENMWFLSEISMAPVEPLTYRKRMYKHLRAAEVRKVTPHTLRHTFATVCLQEGCDIKTLSDLLGHSNAAITMKRYVHTDWNRKQTEIQRIFGDQGGQI